MVWLLVCCLYKEVYLQIFKCMSLWLHGCCGKWEGGPVNRLTTPVGVAVVTPTDRPKSVCNCCLIELFCSVVCVFTLPFWRFYWCRGFCHRTGSDIFLFVCKYIGRFLHDFSRTHWSHFFYGGYGRKSETAHLNLLCPDPIFSSFLSPPFSWAFTWIAHIFFPKFYLPSNFIPILTHSSPFDAYHIIWTVVVDCMSIHSNTQLIKIPNPK